MSEEVADPWKDHDYRIYLLGQFVLEVAKVEALLHATVLKLSSMDTIVFKATHSGLRTDAAMKLIMRLLEARTAQDEEKRFYQEISAHLTQISEARNTILHYGLSWDEDAGTLVASNARVALREHSKRVIPFTADTLAWLFSDTCKIAFHLLSKLAGPTGPPPEFFEGELRKPWLYKSPQP